MQIRQYGMGVTIERHSDSINISLPPLVLVRSCDARENVIAEPETFFMKGLKEFYGVKFYFLMGSIKFFLNKNKYSLEKEWASFTASASCPFRSALHQGNEL